MQGAGSLILFRRGGKTLRGGLGRHLLHPFEDFHQILVRRHFMLSWKGKFPLMAHCLLLRTLTSWLTALLAPPSLSPLIIATAMRVGHVRRSFPPSQPPMNTIPFHGRTGGILRSLYVKARDAPPEMPPMYMRSASKRPFSPNSRSWKSTACPVRLHVPWTPNFKRRQSQGHPSVGLAGLPEFSGPCAVHCLRN